MNLSSLSGIDYIHIIFHIIQNFWLKLILNKFMVGFEFILNGPEK